MIDEKFSFTDLDPQLQQILNNFSALFDIRIAYYLPDGSENTIGKDRGISNYCTLLRSTLGYESTCLALDSTKRNKARETGKIQSYICHGGCNEIIKPVFNDDELLGYIMIGQAVTRKAIPDHVRIQAEQRGMLKELEDAFYDLPYFEKQKMDEIIELFSELADLVMLKNLIKQKELSPVKKVIQYMKTKDHRITLADAARLTNLSESRLRHKFKEEYGETFTQIRTRICMAKAWKLVEEDTGMTIQEIAFSLGFHNELYFSKVFRKYFGCPPSKTGNYFYCSRGGNNLILK